MTDGAIESVVKRPRLAVGRFGALAVLPIASLNAIEWRVPSLLSGAPAASGSERRMLLDHRRRRRPER